MKFVSVPDDFNEATASLDLEEFLTDPRWGLIGDMLPDGIVLVDRRGIVRYMNATAESFNEIAKAAIIGRPLSDFVKQSRLDCSVLLKAFASGGRVNQMINDPGGRDYVLSTRCSRQWDGAINCFMVVQRSLDALSKIASSSGDPQSLAFAPSDGGADLEPIITGETTLALVERGLRAMTMGSRLLILGESGVGKTELARLLHRRSGAPDRPFVHVNCGSIPDSLFESEMFGYERGSFTGASTRGKKGLIEAADGGTLFLDEVGEIPLHCQAKMLQVLEEGVVQRVGATAPRRLRIQVIAATNRDLRILVNEDRFRRDLYYRLSVVTLDLPPLRERRELIPLLLDRFLVEVNRRRSSPLKIDPECRRRLEVYGYPGNVRELQNLVEHLAVVCDRMAGDADLPAEVRLESDAVLPAATPAEDDGLNFSSGFDLREVVRQYESRLIEQAIHHTGSKRKAAELLSVDIATIVRKSRAQTSSG